MSIYCIDLRAYATDALKNNLLPSPTLPLFLLLQLSPGYPVPSDKSQFAQIRARNASFNRETEDLWTRYINIEANLRFTFPRNNLMCYLERKVPVKVEFGEGFSSSVPLS